MDELSKIFRNLKDRLSAIPKAAGQAIEPKAVAASNLRIDFITLSIERAIQYFKNDIKHLVKGAVEFGLGLDEYQEKYLEIEIKKLIKSYIEVDKLLKSMKIDESDVKLKLGKNYTFFRGIPTLNAKRVYEVIERYLFLVA